VLVVSTGGPVVAIGGGLASEGFDVRHAPNPIAGADLVRTTGVDLVLLDLTATAVDPALACRPLANAGAPLVILTARGAGMGHDKRSPLGVVDEITLPCSPKDIGSRLRRILAADQRVPAGRQHKARHLDRLWIDPASRTASLDGEPLELTRIEFDLLEVLSSEPNTVFSRVGLLERVWGPSWYGDTHVVDVHVSNLRRKLGERNGRGKPRLIETVRGIGFRLTVV
jgi:DNA-binding response OmpR family regulator